MKANKVKKARQVTKGIIWQNETIVCIGIRASKNTKTGDMVQTYIIRKDVDPITANRLGLDNVICGNCPHKGIPQNTNKGLATNRTCYVNLGQGVTQVYKAYVNGSYSILTDGEIQALGADKMVRIGTYGDGAFVPVDRWNLLTSKATGKTAYTHQGLNQPEFYMQSVESLEQAQNAWVSGKRTFRVIPIGQTHDIKNEVLCPASAEAGRKATCATCKLCDGSKSAKSIAIHAHGPTKNKFTGV